MPKRKKECHGDCSCCKRYDKKSDPFPDLRRVFGGACDGDMVAAELVESRVAQALEAYRKLYEKNGDGDLLETAAIERIAWCPVKEVYVWVPHKFLGHWKVRDKKLVNVDDHGRPVKNAIKINGIN